MPRRVTTIAVVLVVATLGGCGGASDIEAASRPVTFERRAAAGVSRGATPPPPAPAFGCTLNPASAGGPETDTQHVGHSAPPSTAGTTATRAPAPGHATHAAGGQTGPAEPRPTAPGASPAGHHGDGTCQPTEEQARAARKLVDDTRTGIARFADTNQAVLAGYQPDNVQTTAYWNYVHYVNWNEVGNDTILDPSRPEALLYGQTDKRGWVLIGAMYVMPKAGVPGPAVGGCLTTWHADAAWNGKESPEMLHVWTVDMPGGNFTPNPDAAYIRQL